MVNTMSVTFTKVRPMEFPSELLSTLGDMEIKPGKIFSFPKVKRYTFFKGRGDTILACVPAIMQDPHEDRWYVRNGGWLFQRLNPQQCRIVMNGRIIPLKELEFPHMTPLADMSYEYAIIWAETHECL